MTYLNRLKLWNVTKQNDGLIWWLPTDLKNLTWDISSAAANVLLPGKIVIENTANTISNPFDNILNPKAKNGSYKKLLPFIPATVASSIVKALKLPFSTLEKAIEYWINNNLERWIEWIKWISTKFLANLITDNGNTNSKFMKVLWWIPEWIWDAIWTIGKALPWALQELSKLPTYWIKWYWLNSLDKKVTDWLKSTQIDPDNNFLNLNLMNSADQTNNSGYTPEKNYK